MAEMAIEDEDYEEMAYIVDEGMINTIDDLKQFLDKINIIDKCKANKNITDNTNEENETIKGLCNNMCPSEEITMREKANMVHVLEVNGDSRMLVKSYSRPAADADMAKPELLRPYNILKNTVEYLIKKVTSRERTDEVPDGVPGIVVYDFINDRLRAVRQDMTIQRLTPIQNIDLLEPMIRFHVYFGFKLCELPIKDYDPVLNKKFLLECLKWFLSCCDDIDYGSDFCNYCLNTESVNRDRLLMESLYIICNLDEEEPMLRYLSLEDESLKFKPILQRAYKIAVANMQGNFIEMCRIFDTLCPLTWCAFCMYLPVMQRKALQVLSHSYHSKQLTVPLNIVREWLAYSSDNEVKDACLHYGLTLKGDAVMFNKTDFKAGVPTMPPKKRNLDECKLKIPPIYGIYSYPTKYYGVEPKYIWYDSDSD